MRVAAACARHRVPLTVRGGGTGNYGQAVPLEGGVLSRPDRARPRGRGRGPAPGRFEAGARLLDIDRALRDTPGPSGRWELRFHPSTRKQATIGGFIAGGAAGCGSCTWGQIADPGAVHAVEVVTVEETPRRIELNGRDILKVLHAYGVNGIITEVEVPLAPWQPWAERVVAFPSARRRGALRLRADGGRRHRQEGDRRLRPAHPAAAQAPRAAGAGRPRHGDRHGVGAAGSGACRTGGRRMAARSSTSAAPKTPKRPPSRARALYRRSTNTPGTTRPFTR